MDKEGLADKDDTKDSKDDSNVREVYIVRGAVPFVEYYRYQDETEEIWPDEELLVETAARIS